MSFPGSLPAGWRLKPIGKYGLPTSIDIPAGGLTLGRDEWSDCVIAGDHWTMVSRVHTRVEFIEGRLFVHDLDSTNGTFVNEAKVESAELSSGDVLLLGPKGPRFLVYQAVTADSTELVEAAAVAKAATRNEPASLGQTALLSLKRALGMQATEERSSRVERNQKTHVMIAVALASTLGLSGVVAFTELRREGKAELERSEARTLEHERRVGQIERHADELEARNEALAAQLEHGLASFGSDLEQKIASAYLARDAWEVQRMELDAQRVSIEARLSQLLGLSDASADELADLGRRLEETRTKLARYNPVELEAEKLADVMHVRSAVVLVESRVVFREQESRRLLHSTVDARGESMVNLRNEGVVLDQRSSGSGFVISAGGYILTNAHVAVPNGFKEPLELTSENQVIPEVELEVVFSGTSRRIPAYLVQVDDEEDHDFALIQIDPFQGMPHLDLGDIEDPPPAPGTEVYLCGFPLGTFAVQEGDRVIASTLKGILSRRVGPFVQIDAGVHPGISGGPVTDTHGRVIGIVCSVQATPRGEIAAAIGYALPIGAAQRVLPADALR